MLTFTAVVVPAIVLLPYFVHGYGTYAGTTHPDAWSYTVFSAYLWEYPRLTEGGLAPAYQWAANLSGTRFVASALGCWRRRHAKAIHERPSACCSPQHVPDREHLRGDRYVMGLRNRLLLLVAVGGGDGNWIANATSWVSNLDNLLALSYLPALATLGLTTRRLRRRAGPSSSACWPQARSTHIRSSRCMPRLQRPVLHGLTVHAPGRRSLIGIAICALTTGVLVWPYAADLLHFVQNQLAAGVSTSRARGGAFGGLLDPSRRLARFLGARPGGSRANPLEGCTRAAAAALSGLAIIGLVRLARDRALAQLTTLAILIAGFGVFAWRFSYSYGGPTSSSCLAGGWW